MNLPSLKKDTSLSETVYQTIRKEIAAGNLTAGQKITELEISSSMGISRAPVREAFKRLAMDNLVALIPRSGCYIADLNEKEIDEIFEIRNRLECMALEYAFDHLSVTDLKDLLDQFKACIKMDSQDAIQKEIELDGFLHTMIAVKSGCKNLREMLNTLWARIEIIRFRDAGKGYVPVDAAKEHMQLLKAIINNNRELAMKILETHINNSKRTVMSHMRQNGKKPESDNRERAE